MARPIFVPLEVDYADDKDIAKVARYRRPGEARAVRDLLVQMWCYCKQELSDGHVPLEQVGKLAYPDSEKIGLRDADRLVEIGVIERTETGYYLPGFLKRNKSRAQVEAESAKKAEAGRLGGIRSGESRRNEADVKQGASVWLNTEDRGQRTEDRDVTTVGGERTETLTAPNATFPTHCQDHQNVRDPGPCGGCKVARETYQRIDQERRERSTAAIVADCPSCDPDGWALDQNGEATTHRCRHRAVIA